jgi:hypothetical protein
MPGFSVSLARPHGQRKLDVFYSGEEPSVCPLEVIISCSCLIDGSLAFGRAIRDQGTAGDDFVTEFRLIMRATASTTYGNVGLLRWRTLWD